MIYFIQAEGVGHIKIGFTDHDDALVRLATLQTGSPVLLRLLGTIPGTPEDEKNLHRRFASAKVRGEWFKPAPELLAMISPVESLSREGVEVVERSVSIRVLTVGRKQFTKALLDQLPESDCVDWAAVSRRPEDALLDFVTGDVWGWVKSGTQTFGAEQAYTFAFRWVIFERDGRLHRHRDYDNRWALDFDPGISQSDITLISPLYASRLLLPGWRPEDQLFFGV